MRLVLSVHLDAKMEGAALVQTSVNAKKDGQASTAQILYAKTPARPVRYVPLRTCVYAFQALKGNSVNRQHVFKNAAMVVIVQLLIHVAVHQGGLIRTVPHPFVNRLVETAQTARGLTLVLALLIGLVLIVENQYANKLAIMELVVLPLILVYARQAGVATTVRSLYVIKDSLFRITNNWRTQRLHTRQVIGLNIILVDTANGVLRQMGLNVLRKSNRSPCLFRFLVRSGGECYHRTNSKCTFQ